MGRSASKVTPTEFLIGRCRGGFETRPFSVREKSGRLRVPGLEPGNEEGIGVSRRQSPADASAVIPAQAGIQEL